MRARAPVVQVSRERDFSCFKVKAMSTRVAKRVRLAECAALSADSETCTLCAVLSCVVRQSCGSCYESGIGFVPRALQLI